MSTRLAVHIPDIGGAKGVQLIEWLVKPGDRVAKDQPLLTLEGDKATMEVPSPAAGVVAELVAHVGHEVSEGSLVLWMDSEVGASAPAASAPVSSAPVAPASAAPVAPVASTASATSSAQYDCDVLVLGAGPGGYTAAFRAADLDQRVVLVERYPSLGGVCLNVGCIPSKALLHAAAVIDEAAEMAAHGVSFGDPKIDLDGLRGHKDKVVSQLTKGLSGMARQRKVDVVQGSGRFTGPHEVEVQTESGPRRISFRNAIIAAGSQPIKIPGFPWDDPRMMDSTDALMLKDIPKRLLIVGGGIIGLEMGCVYAALGSRVSVVELMDQLMPGADKDLIKPLQARLAKRFEAIHLGTRVTAIEAGKKALTARFEGGKAPASAEFDRVLVAVGRTPNGKRIDAAAAGVAVDERGFIAVDAQMRTNVPHIFAIGDIVGQPMLAHKATHEGKVAAEVAAGMKTAFQAKVIPSVAYTDPEIAWVGVTETDAAKQGLSVEKGVFPWAASGRAIGLGRTEGMTKLLFDPQTHRLVGAGIVGVHAGDLIAELALAIEMGCEAGDIGLTVHPHPTLSESVGMAAEVFEGTITDLYIPKRKKG